MTVDGALASRVEAWIDTAGHDAERVRDLVESVLAAGFTPSTVRLILDTAAEGAADRLAALAADTGVATLDGRASALNDRLDQTGAEFLFVVRWGTVDADLLPKAVGFLDRFPSVSIAYGDSTTAQGAPLLRPRLSPIRLRNNDYLGPVVVARVADVRELGGFDEPARRAQVLDLALRAVDRGLAVELIPDGLAVEQLSGEEFAGTSEAQAAIVRSRLEEAGVQAEVEEIEPFVRRVRYAITGDPLVSIVIPTRGGSAEIAGSDRVLVVEAVRGIVERSTYSNLEFVIVADRETPESVIAELEAIAGDRLKLVAWEAPFNFSGKMNRGAIAASGDYLLLLNDDVEIVTDDWIEHLLGLAQQPGVGIVGAQLYFEDSTLQHAGQIYTGGVAGHAAFGWPGGRDDSIASLKVDHEVSGVTAACAMVSRELFLEVGGFSLAFPGNYNDVDLNMKIRIAGRSAVFSPWVRLYHFESKTRDPRILGSDIATLQARWSRRMQIELYSRML